MRKAHHGLGLFLAAGAVLLVATGLALQHPAWIGRGAMPPRVVAASSGAPERLLRASPALLEESRDGGRTWLELPLPFAPDRPVALAFAPVDTGSVWLLGETELLHSADGGGVWERRDLPAGITHDDPPLALAITADGRPLVVTTTGAWLDEAPDGAWRALWRVEPTRGDRLRLWARRLHAGHWGPSFTPRLYDIGALLFTAVVVSGLFLGLRRRKRHRKSH
jgi:hypothetical protein